MTADYIKTAVMYHFRFLRHYPYIASEVDWYPSKPDVLAMNEQLTKVVEIEVKISLTDLRAEFNHKKRKHENYACGWWTGPTHFYFAFPEGSGFQEYEKIPTNYGIILVKTTKGRVGDCKFVRRAKKLPCRNVKKEIALMLLRRMGSELIYLRIDKYKGEK